MAVAVLPAPASAQLSTCGEGFQLFIRNPDMGTPQSDGKFHASGNFFMQFQVIGERADDIETFAFSVGLPVDNPEQICSLPVWPGGLMLEAYKADFDKEDGFFILMNTHTDTTPQHTDLSVAVHGYDGAGNELARFWGTAIVESCSSQGLGDCSDDEAQANDKTMPWPIILPGDGVKTFVDGLTVEFSEELSSLTVLLNNVDITAELEEWEGRLWDADTFYDHGPRGVVGQVAPMCTYTQTPFQNCITPGPAYQWRQRALTDDDVVRVVATDLAGNTAVKEIHVGSSVAGGAIADGLPILQMTFDNTTLPTYPGQDVVFSMTMQNNGGGEGHPFARADVPAGWDFEWVPGHKPVPAGGSSQQDLVIKVPADATIGRFEAKALIDYRQGDQDKTLQSPLTVIVEEPPEADLVPEAGPVDEEASPAVLLVLLVAALLAVAATRRR